MREMRETRETRKMGVQHNNNLIKVVKRRPDFEIHHVVNLFPTIRNLWNGLAPLVKVHLFSPSLYFIFLAYFICRPPSTIRHILNLTSRYPSLFFSFNSTYLLFLVCSSFPYLCPCTCPLLSLLFFYFCLLFLCRFIHGLLVKMFILPGFRHTLSTVVHYAPTALTRKIISIVSSISDEARYVAANKIKYPELEKKGEGSGVERDKGEEGERRTSLFNLFDFLYLSFGDEHPVHGIH